MVRFSCVLLATTALWLMAFLPGCRSDGAVPAERAFLANAWTAYKETFIRPEGYVWDQARQEVTSEGQSYALLRAVWMNDRETFARVHAWTESHLARPDGLYSWQWTPKDGGRVVDANTATDADQDIAFALILAADAFDAPAYRERARTLLAAIRHGEGIALGGGWVPCAGNWAVSDRIINFSYFTFYAYPFFAALDPEGDWLGVRERCYDLLVRFLAQKNVVLPADFAVVDSKGNFAPPPAQSGLSGDFSFDAMRVYWRVAMDCRLNSHPRACSDPSRIQALVDILARDGRIFSRYQVDGRKQSAVSSVSFAGSALPALAAASPQLADAMVKKELSPSALTPLLRNPDRYYDNNWTWFGLAARSGLLTAPVDRSFPAKAGK